MSEDLVSEFIFDARDHLATAGADLLDLEKSPGSLDSLNALMGTLHTLKGNSGILDLQNFYKLMHDAENLLQTVREKQIECPQPAVDLLLQVLDTAEAMLGSLEKEGHDTVDWLDTLYQALNEADAQLESGREIGSGPGPAAGAGEAYEAEADGDRQVFEAAEIAATPDPIPGLEAIPGATSLVTLADGDLDRLGDHFPNQVKGLFQAGGGGLVVDLKGLTSLSGRELKLILAASRKNPGRTAFLVDPDEQPNLHRLFQVLDPDRRLNLFPDQAQAQAHLGGPPPA